MKSKTFKKELLDLLRAQYDLGTSDLRVTKKRESYTIEWVRGIANQSATKKEVEKLIDLVFGDKIKQDGIIINYKCTPSLQFIEKARKQLGMLDEYPNDIIKEWEEAKLAKFLEEGEVLTGLVVRVTHQFKSGYSLGNQIKVMLSRDYNDNQLQHSLELWLDEWESDHNHFIDEITYDLTVNGKARKADIKYCPTLRKLDTRIDELAQSVIDELNA